MRRAGAHLGGQPADLPRREPVRRIVVSRDDEALGLDLAPESYCALAGGNRAFEVAAERRDDPVGSGHHRFAGPGPAVDGGEDLAAAGVDDRDDDRAVLGRIRQVELLRARELDAARERLEARDADDRQPVALRERARRRDPDAQPREAAGADPDADALDVVPRRARVAERPLEQRLERGGVARALGVVAALDLAAVRRDDGDRGRAGRRVEPDDRSRCALGSLGAIARRAILPGGAMR